MKNIQAVLLFAAISLMSNYASATASTCAISAFNKWEPKFPHSIVTILEKNP